MRICLGGISCHVFLLGRLFQLQYTFVLQLVHVCSNYHHWTTLDPQLYTWDSNIYSNTIGSNNLEFISASKHWHRLLSLDNLGIISERVAPDLTCLVG